jgi:hypothetical protein
MTKANATYSFMQEIKFPPAGVDSNAAVSSNSSLVVAFGIANTPDNDEEKTGKITGSKFILLYIYLNFSHTPTYLHTDIYPFQPPLAPPPKTELLESLVSVAGRVPGPSGITASLFAPLIDAIADVFD